MSNQVKHAFTNESLNATVDALRIANAELVEALRNARDVLGMNEYERESCRRRIDAVLAKAGL